MKKETVQCLTESAILQRAQWLVADGPNRLQTYRIETDILLNLQRISYFCTRMARASMVPTAPVEDD